MTDEKPDPSQKVTEPIARAAYLAQTAPRSLHRLALDLAREFTETVSERTLKNWSKKNGWQRLAREHDERVAQKAATIVANRQARTAAERADWLRDKADELIETGLRLAHEGDPAALVRAGIEAHKYVDQMLGGGEQPPDGPQPTDMSPEAVREREIARIMGLTSKIRGTNGHANGHANGADHGADDTKH